jgi:hypothetical protein
LNKACPKDEYLIPRICQIVDSTASCELLSFLDGYSVYYHISLAIDDEKNNVHHAIWDLLLHQDGIQAEECESNLSEVYSHHLGASDWEKCQSLL